LKEGPHSAQGGSVASADGQGKKFSQQGTNGYWQTLKDIVPCTLADAIALCREANRLRAAAKQNLQRTIISAKGNKVNRIDHGEGVIEKGAGGDRGYTEPLEFLLRQVELKSEGAFGLFLRQPLVWAVFVLAGGFGWTILVETGMLPGL
jgi:hypothetical protein